LDTHFRISGISEICQSSFPALYYREWGREIFSGIFLHSTLSLPSTVVLVMPRVFESGDYQDAESGWFDVPDVLDAVSDGKHAGLSPHHIFFKGVYPSSHWCNRREPEYELGQFAIGLQRFEVKLNPTDCRGYRALVSLVESNGLVGPSVFNRYYTAREKVGLGIALALVADVYEQQGLVAQIQVAANKSHTLVEGNVTVAPVMTPVLMLGSAAEPNKCHGHVIGRGIIGHPYIAGVPLRGPRPGLGFDMFGGVAGEPGNEKKVPWNPEELKAVTSVLRAKLAAHFEAAKL